MTTGGAGSQIDKVTLTFTGTEGDRYLVLANCQAGNLSALETDIYMSQDGALTFYQHTLKPVATADFSSCPMAFEFVLGTGANNFNFTLAVVPTAGRAVVREAYIVAFKLNVQDATQPASEIQGGGNTNGTTYAAVETMSLTVPVAGDYLIYATANVRKNETTNSYYIKLTANGTDYSESDKRSVSITHGYPWSSLVKLTLAAGSYDIKIEFKVDAPGTMIADWTFITALRADLFPQLFYAESRGNTNISTATPTWTNKITLTARTQNQPHVLLSSSIARQTVITKIIHRRTQLDAADIAVSQDTSISTTNKSTHGATANTTPAAGDHTFTMDGTKQTSGLGSGTIVMAESSIAVIQLQDNATLYGHGGKILKGQLL